MCGFDSLHSHHLKGKKLSKVIITTEEQKLINQWLKNNKPTVCPPMRRSDPETINKKYGWGSKKKKKK